MSLKLVALFWLQNMLRLGKLRERCSDMVLIIIILVLAAIVSVAAFFDDSDRTITWEDIDHWEQERRDHKRRNR